MSARRWLRVGLGITAVMGSGIVMAHGGRNMTCRIEVDRAVLPADTVLKAVIKVTLDAPQAPSKQERPPVNLAIVLDHSGSMSGEKIVRAQDAAIEALRRLGPQDLFSVVIYDHEVETIVPAQRAVNTEWIESRIREIRARGNTALFSGVSQGAAEVRKNLEDRRYVSRIILLSDGLANVGPSAPEDLGRLGAGLLKEGIAVTTVGVGTDYNEDLMTQLSQKSDGNAYFAEAGKDLPRIFAAELGDVLSVVAKEVSVEIECPAGFRPVRIIGREGRIRDNRVEIYLNQLYGGQQKYALVEVEVPATARDEVREIAVASCRYEDALTRKRAEATSRATVRFSLRREEVDKSANVIVQREIVVNRVALAKDRAIELNDAGKVKEAAEELKRESESLREAGRRFGLDDLVEQATALDGQAHSLKDRKMSSAERKALRTDSYQTRNQQAEK